MSIQQSSDAVVSQRGKNRPRVKRVGAQGLWQSLHKEIKTESERFQNDLLCPAPHQCLDGEMVFAIACADIAPDVGTPMVWLAKFFRGAPPSLCITRHVIGFPMETRPTPTDIEMIGLASLHVLISGRIVHGHRREVHGPLAFAFVCSCCRRACKRCFASGCRCATAFAADRAPCARRPFGAILLNTNAQAR